MSTSRFSAVFLMAAWLALAGCSKSVPPVIEPDAHTQKLSDGTYEVQLRYSVKSSGGPCLNKDWFKTVTNYSTNWLYLKTLDGVMTAEQIVVTIEAGQRVWPYAHTNMQGTVSFTNAGMSVQLEQPSYPDGVHMQGYIPYFLNGTYKVVMDSPSKTARGCVKSLALENGF